MRFTFSFRFSFRLTWRDWTYNSVELPSRDETMEHAKQNQVIKPVTLGQLNHTEQFENMGFMKVRFHDKEKHLVLQTTRVPDLQFHYIKTDSSTGKNWLFDYIKTEFDWKKNPHFWTSHLRASNLDFQKVRKNSTLRANSYFCALSYFAGSRTRRAETQQQISALPTFSRSSQSASSS